MMKSMKEGNFIEELDLFGESISLPLRKSKDCLETYIREAVCIANEARHRGCDQFNGILRAPIKPLGLDTFMRSCKGVPNLHAAVLSFSARLLIYVNEKCDGSAPMAYKRAGVSRQVYSRIVASNDAKVDKRTTMLFCIGLQLSIDEAELLMKSAGYAFSDTIPEDMVFRYCIQNKIWNLDDVNEILIRCGLGVCVRESDT
jgi:hypothetical protein